MSKNYLKLILGALLLALVGAGVWGALSGMAALILYFQTGADPAAALHIVPNVPPDLHVRLSWRPDPPDTGRALDPMARKGVESSYLRAWLQLHLAAMKHENYGLKTYFSGPALAALEQPSNAGWHIDEVDTAHQLELHFYSADGAIISFTDHGAWVSQLARAGAGLDAKSSAGGDAPAFYGDFVADYDIVMFLEDGNWRVRHWVRRAARDIEASPPAAPPLGAGFVVREGQTLASDGRDYKVAGIDYYPRTAPGDEFWPAYTSSETARDFALMQRLGINTVRVDVPFQQFGGPAVDEAMLERLGDLLSHATQANLKVIVTLFGHFSDYQVIQWPAADRHLEALLRRFHEDPAILAWDLKNAPDVDYAGNGKELVNAWLRHVARLARSCDSNHLLTVGWGRAAAAADLSDVLDIASFRHFESAASLEAGYAALRARVAAPILISAFGLSTWNSFFFPGGHTELEQASYYAEVRRVLRRVGAVGSVASTLHDYDHAPKALPAWQPWVTGAMQNLGVVRRDGTLKPAAALLREEAEVLVASAPVWGRLFKPFWLVVALLALGCGVVAVRGYARRRRTRAECEVSGGRAGTSKP